MNQRRFVGLSAVWELIAFGTAVAHCFSQGSPPAKPESPAIRQWEALLPQIAPALARGGETCPEGMEIDIVDAADITGDGQPEALIDFCHGGAYTDCIVLMQLQDGKPVLATFRDAAGKRLDSMEFAQGSSVMHSVDVRLVPEEHAVYDIAVDEPTEGDAGSCKVTSYVWKPKLRSFRLSTAGTGRATRSICSK